MKTIAIALLLSLTTGCGWVSMTFHDEGRPRPYADRSADRAIQIEPHEVDTLIAAGGVYQGTAVLRGHWGVRNPVTLLQRAERKLARRGVTHFLYQTQGTEVWYVNRPGYVNTRCNGQYQCRSTYQGPSTVQRSRRTVTVLRFRVSPNYWRFLPEHLVPR